MPERNRGALSVWERRSHAEFLRVPTNAKIAPTAFKFTIKKSLIQEFLWSIKFISSLIKKKERSTKKVCFIYGGNGEHE